MLPIPYGKTSYINILARHFAVVDKTEYLKIIEKEPYQELLLVRPRRFGKSLFIDLMQSYFDLNLKNRFDELFHGSYIHSHQTPMQGSCYILRFDLSGINKDPEAIRKSFTAKIRQGLLRFAQNYKSLQEPILSVLHENNDDPAIMLDASLQAVMPATKKQILLLIDEYDLLTETFLKGDPKVLKETLESTGFVTDFYTIIKKRCKDALYKVFATGVSALEINSKPLTVNSFRNISNDQKYAGMLGFDEQELRNLIENTIDTDVTGRNIEDILADMKDYYSGYSFGDAAGSPVLNPTQCLYYLNSLADTNAEPMSLSDSNVAGSGNSLAAVLDACGEEQRVTQLTQAVINGRSVELPAITAQTEQNSTQKLSFRELVSTLTDFGYLTWSNGSSSQLCCPNKTMRELFIKFYFNRIYNQTDLRFDRNDVEAAAFKKLNDGDIKPLLTYVSHMLTLACPQAAGFNGRFLQLATLMAFTANSKYKVWTEQEAFARGHSDLFIEEKNRNTLDRRCYLMEFKYLKSSEADEYRIKTLAEDAKEQLLRYSQSETYRHLTRLKKIAAVFSGTELVHFEVC